MSQPDSPPLLVIIRPAQTHQQSHFSTPYKRSAPVLSRRDDKAKQCYESEDACKDGTSCSDRGACALMGKKGDGECWGCKCSNGFAGVECQKTDYSV